VGRRQYLDWLRGVAVLIMVETHLIYAWTRAADRSEPAYAWAMFVGGHSAPLFLFLAGIALALAAGSRTRSGSTPSEAAALARRRGWQILGLAFLFRLQSFVISGGVFPQTLLKVDILNVMGLGMLLAAVLWARSRHRASRTAWLTAAAVLIVLATPIVRAMPLPSWLPDPLAWYLQPVADSGAFTLFPWLAFLLIGAAVGLWLDSAATVTDERRLVVALSVAGPVVALGAYAATFLPPLYAMTQSWSASPAVFFMQLGVLMMAIPPAYVWCRRASGWSPLREFGVASLFVYWIHVEMVFGVVSLPLHRALSFEQAMAVYAALCILLYGLIKLKDKVLRTLAPSHFALRTLFSSARQISG
jgi:uncharacterized membrane protein